jgi:hypothetical protein
MIRSLLSVSTLILVLSLASAAYTYFRAGALASADQIAAKGLASASRDTAIFYAGVAMITGIIAYFVFRAMFNAAPEVAPSRFLWLALGIGVVLEIMAAAVFKMRGILEFTVLHAAHIVGLGWLLPMVYPR